ncbi:Tat pathway signal protein [Streptomyces sp. NPDC057302]|uniref:Tat pathway signal protein n=1 Tax=Streptomyces sp. NPDC057302 TaxID=3346094 RepID=UPI00362D22EB
MPEPRPTARPAASAALFLALAALLALLVPSALPVTAAHAAEPECAPLALAPFGDPGTALGKATVAPDATTCYTFTTTEAGLHLVSLDDSSNEAHTAVHSGDTPVDCYDTEYRDAGWCDLAASTTYTLKISNNGWDDADTAVTVVPLGSNRGCAPKTGTDWDQPTPTRTSVSPAEVDCQPFDAEPGDRIRLTDATKVYGQAISWITDATGARICPRFPEDDEDSCVLPGKGPYRALSRVTSVENGFPAEYAVTARRLNDPQGCPSAPVRLYGPLSAQDLTTTPCFTVTTEKAGKYRLDSVDKDGETGPVRVHDRSGKTLCRNTEQPCRLPSAGAYTAYLDNPSPFHDTAHGLIVLDRASDSGCVKSEMGTHKGEFSTAGQYDCLNLPAPKDSRIAALTPLSSSGTDAAVEVLDSEGTEQCDAEKLAAGDCALTGPAPYRALVHADGSPRTGPYTVAVHRTDAANDCPVLPAGSFTTDGAKATFSTGNGVFSRCLTIPADTHTSTEALQLVATSGDVPAKFSVLDSTGKRVCDSYATTNGWTLCALTPGKAHTVLVTGRDQTADYTLTRRDVTSTASSAGCAKTAAAKVGGPSVKGTYGAPGSLRCHQVTTPAATDVVHLNVRDALATADMYVLDGDGESECDRRAQACAATGSTTHQVLVQTPVNREAAPQYRLDALRIATAEGPVDECTKVPSIAYGYGPVTGTLDEAHTATCAVLPTARNDHFEAEISDTTGATEEAVPALYNSAWKNGCSRAVPMDYVCGVNAPEADPKKPSVLVIGLPEKAPATSYRATLKCSSNRCGDEKTTITGITPATAPGGTKPTLTVTGTAINPGATVQLTQSGKTLTAKTTSISADNRTLKATLDLTDIPAGTWDASVIAGGSQYPSGTFTVTEPTPRNTTAPKVTGTAAVGSKVTADPGSWTAAPTSYTYQWKADGAAIADATASTYKIPAAHLNKKLSVTVTAHKAGHEDATATSSTVTVAKGAAPKASAKPTISGTAKVGKILKAAQGTWSPAPSSYTYQWYANGTKITGATKSSLTLKSAQRSKKITVKVTAHRPAHHNGTSTSKATGTIAS